MLTQALLLTLVGPEVTDRSLFAIREWRVDRPRVEVWTGRGEDAYSRGDRARIYFRADRDAFLTVFRVDTDGRVRVLFPREPWEDAYVRGGRDYEVEGADGRAFYVDDYPGVGYVFAVAAVDPFDYSAIVTGDHWDYRLIADGRVRGDPYVALTDLSERLVAEGYEDWDYDIVPYYVERHYDYPRFACYGCHAYASWTYWDPYSHYCSRFRVVIYDDPWYYPYRYPYYGGTRVVIVRPYRPAPRFVFKEWGGRSRDTDPYVTRTRQREGEERPRDVRPRDRDGTPSVIPPPRTRDPVRTRAVEQDRDGRDGGRGRDDERGGRDGRDGRDGRTTTGDQVAPSRGTPQGTQDRTPNRTQDRAPSRTQDRTEDRAQSDQPDRAQPRDGRRSSGESGATERAPATRQEPRREEPRAASGDRGQERASGGGGNGGGQDRPRQSPPAQASRPRNDGGGSQASAPRSAPARGGTPELKRRKP